MLTLLVHDWRRFLIGRLLPLEGAGTALLAAVWGSVLACVSSGYSGPGGVAELWASAPYDFVYAMAVPLLVIVNCGVRFGWDYTQGTEKYELLLGFRRAPVLGSRLVTLAGAALVMFLAAAVGYLAVPVITGRLADVSWERALLFLVRTATVWAGSLPLLMIVVLASLIVRTLEGIVGVGLVLLAVFGSVVSLAGTWAWLVPTVFMVRPVAALAPNALLALTNALLATGLAAIASLRLWTRKDILR